MTREEAKLVLCANVMVACDRAGFDKRTCELVKNALDVVLKELEAEGKWIYGEDETGVDGWHCSECNFFEPWFYDFDDDIDFIKR